MCFCGMSKKAVPVFRGTIDNYSRSYILILDFQLDKTPEILYSTKQAFTESGLMIATDLALVIFQL